MTTATRRTVVRAAAWSTPAVAMVATPPAMAATSTLKTISFNPGTSSVARSSDGTWRFIFAGATLAGHGAPVDALTLTVSFLPDSGSQRLLAFYAQGPAGWLGPAPGTAASGLYSYLGGSPADGAPVAIPDGAYFATAYSDLLEKGSLVLTFRATGFHDAVYTTRVPGTRSLSFDPGSSYVTIDGAGRWALSFQGASVGVRGGDLSPSAITMTVTFTPDAGFTGRSMAVKAGGPAGWSSATARTTATQTYTYASSVSAGGSAPVGNGAFCYTLLVGNSQPGTFNVVFSATGFAPVTYRIHGPKSITFDPGASHVFDNDPNDPQGIYGVSFSGASLSLHGVDLPASALSMTATFIPDPGFAGHDSLWHSWNGPDGWSSYAQNGVAQVVTYSCLSPVAAGSTVPISDNSYVFTAEPTSVQQGTLRFTFSAPELQPVIWDAHIAPPPKVIQVDWGLTMASPDVGQPATGTWRLTFVDAVITLQGQNQPAGGVSIVGTFQATSNAKPKMLYQNATPSGWTATYPNGQQALVEYTNTAALPAGQQRVLNGTYFGTYYDVVDVPGQFTVTVSCPGFQDVSRSWVV